MDLNLDDLFSTKESDDEEELENNKTGSDSTELDIPSFDTIDEKDEEKENNEKKGEDTDLSRQFDPDLLPDDGLNLEGEHKLFKKNKGKENAITEIKTEKKPEPKKMSPPSSSLFSPVPEPEEINTVSLYWGPENAGKTWLGCTADLPIYHIETEGGHNILTIANSPFRKNVVAVKLQKDDLERPSKVWFGGRNDIWYSIEEVVEELKSAKKGVVVIDSSSDLLGAAVSTLSIDWGRGDKAFPPMLYGQVYGMLGDLINLLRNYHHVVLTARIKSQEHYPDVWRQAANLSDVIVEIGRAKLDESRYYRVTKGPLKGRLLTEDENPSWSTFIYGNADDYRTVEQVKEEKKGGGEKEIEDEPDAKRTKLIDSVIAGEKALTDKGVKYNVLQNPDDKPIEELEKYVQYLRRVYRENK